MLQSLFSKTIVSLMTRLITCDHL